MTDADGDALFYAEIDRHCRRRFVGVALAAGFAALMLVGLSYSLKLMHGDGWSTAQGRIVAVGTDPSNGEATMTSEFADASGALHRDTQTAGYHYAAGEPQVGQSIAYLYKDSGYTGEFTATPRADWILQWMFGIPAAIFTVGTVLFTWLVLRQRNFRRALVRGGRREPAEQLRIEQKAVPLVTSAGGQRPMMWRLQARYFEPTRTEFVDCRGDWQHEEAPDLRPDSPVPPIFVDTTNPARYWLPVGALDVKFSVVPRGS